MKGPTVFKGYLGNSAATAECMTADGFFKTGDVGYVDEQGNTFITDRIKQLIKYKGYQVAPAELENLLSAHTHVSDVAVCGRYVEAIASEVPVAFVVPGAGVSTSDELAIDIVQWFDKQVSSHKRLRGGLVWVDSIPKSAAGKVLRKKLALNPTKGVGMSDFADRSRLGAKL